MAEATDSRAILLENLRDAGCDAALTAACMARMETEGAVGLLPLLLAYRAELMGVIHAEQERLDCLDFLLYRLKKETRT